MKFAHISDCHLGTWRNEILKEINMEAFERAFDLCKEEDVNFVLISGDLFDTSRPPIDILKRAVRNFRDLQEHGIPIYVIQGSHDFSPTGKTFLEVLKEADILHIPVKADQEGDTLKLVPTREENTKTQIAGLPGKIGGLEEVYYKHIDQATSQETSDFKIFMFHSGIKELKPDFFKHMKSMPKSLLPPNFNYYAGGHIHKPIRHSTKNGKTIVFPGPLFPTNYRELEKFKYGGFYLVEVSEGEVKIKRQDLQLYELTTLCIDADNRSAREVQREIKKQSKQLDPTDKIILIRVEGSLKMGTPSDIEFRKVRQQLETEGAKITQFHTANLSTKEFEEISTSDTGFSQEELEETLIREHAGQHSLENMNKEQEISLSKKLIEYLAKEKKMDETNEEYDKRIQSDVLSTLQIKEKWRDTDEI